MREEYPSSRSLFQHVQEGVPFFSFRSLSIWHGPSVHVFFFSFHVAWYLSTLRTRTRGGETLVLFFGVASRGIYSVRIFFYLTLQGTSKVETENEKGIPPLRSSSEGRLMPL